MKLHYVTYSNIWQGRGVNKMMAREGRNLTMLKMGRGR